MIDQQVFAEGMGQLGGAFGREIDGPVSRMYYGILSPALSNEQFVDAVTKTIASERFWPSPVVILDKAGKDLESVADAAWRAMNDTVRSHGGYLYMPASVYQELDEPTKAGIKAVGGLREIANCPRERWVSLCRKFTKAYQEAASPRPAIASGEKVDPKVKQLVASTAKQLTLTSGRDRAVKESD